MKMTAKTGKDVKKLETLMKPYEFDDKALITILRFLFKSWRACDFDEVSKEMALLVMEKFMKDGTTLNLTVRMTSREGGNASYFFLKVKESRSQLTLKSKTFFRNHTRRTVTLPRPRKRLRH